MAYRHITRFERERIAAYHAENYSIRMIANILGRSPSSISRELRRNRCGRKIGYISDFAEFHYRNRRAIANQQQVKIIEHSPLMIYIIDKLRARWSPEIISHKLREHPDLPYVSAQTIYAWIAERHTEMKRYLSVLSNRKPKPKGASKKETICNRRSIEDRPEIANQRKRIGDWEGDTIVSSCRKRAIATFTERCSRFLLAKNMSGRNAQDVHDASVKLFASLPANKRLTCTNDNGTEFAKHEETAKELGIAVYFAHPYCSYERGSNERNNRELRRFFPKGTNFAEIPDWEFDWAVHLINNRPRKVHNYRTAAEVFYDHQGVAL